MCARPINTLLVLSSGNRSFATSLRKSTLGITGSENSEEGHLRVQVCFGNCGEGCRCCCKPQIYSSRSIDTWNARRGNLKRHHNGLKREEWWRPSEFVNSVMVDLYGMSDVSGFGWLLSVLLCKSISENIKKWQVHVLDREKSVSFFYRQ